MKTMIETRIQSGKKEGPMCSIAFHQVSSALKKMKIGKVSRPFGVVAEIMKAPNQLLLHGPCVIPIVLNIYVDISCCLINSF